VTTDFPTMTTVNFSGAASGSATPNSAGQYGLITSNAGLGTVSAVATDWMMQSSNTMQDTIAVTPPSLTLSLNYGSARSVTLSGQLTALDHSARAISFSGVATGNVNTASDGSFTYAVQASAL